LSKRRAALYEPDAHGGASMRAMNSPTFAGQTAIITGGVSGIGLAIARRIQAQGGFVVAFDRDDARFAEVTAEFGARGKCAMVDVTDEVTVQRAIAAVAAERGRIDILINSAGITGRTNLKSHEVEPTDFDAVIRVNVRGPFLTTKAALPVMLQRGYGRVLHIASIAGKEGNAGMLAYSTSKAALIGMTKVQGKDYAETGVTVNALAPAVIRTPMVAALPEAQVKYMTEKIPMKRCGTLEEIAAVAAFIVSPENSFTTGFTYDLTGGRAVY
jgi:2-dehydro-3-deoxy-L-rhamnonate dehydrogenase (NAD+)